jgi:hypothetical protein
VISNVTKFSRCGSKRKKEIVSGLRVIYCKMINMEDDEGAEVSSERVISFFCSFNIFRLRFMKVKTIFFVYFF